MFADLKARNLFEFDPLAKWLTEQGEYALTNLPDGSKWTIGLGPADGRYLHLHPGRWVPHTMRVQANTLKSAVMAHAHSQLTGRDANAEPPFEMFDFDHPPFKIPPKLPEAVVDEAQKKRCINVAREALAKKKKDDAAHPSTG